MDLLLLVEMYVRWKLQEDISDLRALMVCFDCEKKIPMHELGQYCVHEGKLRRWIDKLNFHTRCTMPSDQFP